ncbi:ANTH-domain-containing protein [Epithele typhae]|uniref:ANTH-domain-containing protein n=1 Tax=Epithele typhae TaxID=378194 RepID=UPI00200857C6|nr:ANTH-domain-containing protein [Epithele typhae]KAH9921691.1 ANTH-domain-containing protein [Epithele typhae]
MTSFEKTVKLACKPKAAPPKAKYLDPIIAATWSEDGAVHDVCNALSPRFREPNVIVVFKALIVLHTMIRNGATDNILKYLSSSDVLKLRNVSTAQWEGYSTPQNLQNYSKYLDLRIRAYRELKHDAIRVQSENNRDMRNSAAIDEDADHGSSRKRGKASPQPPPSNGNLSRSKTMAGRKLRVMTVEKGLLRETKIVQRMVDGLVECRFYLDDLEDELNITSLRMLVKDLLICFQACNEGVINVLEHYFEMSRIDAQEALSIYKHFCRQTEHVVEFLGVAKKLQNLLNVPIPNLRHAPVSLASSLEEYLNDSNFEQNRIEYKTQKDSAERNAKLGIKPSPKPVERPSPAAVPAAEASSSSGGDKTPGQKAMIDFFSAIEGEQQTMFNPQTNSPTSSYFQQQAMQNPFQQPMMTGAMLGAQAFGQPQMQMGMQMHPQATGFLMPQHTVMPMGSTNPFGMGMQQQPQQHPSFGSFLAPQATGMLQPQMTGANPFRQSMLLPQNTATPFGAQQMGGAQQNTNPFPMQPQPSPSPQPQNPMQVQGNSPFQPSGMTQPLSAINPSQPAFPFLNAPNVPAAPTPSIAQPFAQLPSMTNGTSVPPRSATAPLSGPGTSSSPPLTGGVKTHQTGSRNPFGQIVTPPPPVPRVPTLMELAMGVNQPQQQQAPQQAQAQQPQQTGAFGGFNSSFSTSQPLGTGIASSFAFDSKPNASNPGSSLTRPLTSQPTSSTITSSAFSDTLFSSVSSQPTGATSASGAPSISFSSASSTSPIPRQQTGFSGLKAFKPSSSFGAALLDTTSTGAPSGGSSFPGLNSQPTGMGSFGTSSSLGVGLRPQTTGTLGGANPFRATMFSATSSPGNFGSGTTPSFMSSPMGSAPGATSGSFGGLGSLGTNPTGVPMGAFGGGPFGLGLGGQDASKQQQSLI